ncbi:probable G-protein coupled receptor 132 [Hypanus sabinus]|uniref:probable G-protein coupled receptor 132 n=1 Tax=Hypanus sabinus TaxID=79690 RepID=UPI0028C4EED7|nr:probable G-protein coupled receptor 132 [Hypanus sabinus]XP_059806962.1 probable G-protein coupled receptor 132 [Hypanus sabinus]XP_059806963.1 probable G-protein coupled receptor 132 [Hypanus sabinus]
MNSTVSPGTDGNESVGPDVPCNQTMCGIQLGVYGVALAVMYSVTFIVSLTMNCLTLWPIILQVKQKNTLGIYLLSLNISDLLYALTIPLWIIYYYNGHRWNFGWITCHFSGFIFYSNVYISILLLCCISMDRYLAVIYPMRSQNFRRPSVAIKISLLVFLSVFVIHLFILFGTFLDTKPDMANLTCFEHIPLVKTVAIANYGRVFIGFLLPLLLMIFCYQRIFRGIRKSSTLQGKQKAKVKQLSISVIIIFLVCFGPYHLILLFRTINFSLMECTCHFEQQILFYFSISLAISSFNSALDPILYVLVSDNAKRDLKRSFASIGYGNLRKKSQSTSPTLFSRVTV